MFRNSDEALAKLPEGPRRADIRKMFNGIDDSIAKIRDTVEEIGQLKAAILRRPRHGGELAH